MLRSNRRGFTLVEILVALAVLAIALTAIFRALAQSIDLSADLRDRTFALWVAQDTAALHRINGVAPAPGQASAERDMGGRRWSVSENTAEVGSGVRRIDIVVTPAGSDHSLARLVSFMGSR